MKKIILIAVLAACTSNTAEFDISESHSVKGQIACLPIDGFSQTCRDETGETWICNRSNSTGDYACARISAANAMWDAFVNNKHYEAKNAK